MTIESTLEERGSRYGDFTHHAKIAQDLQDVMRTATFDNGANSWRRLSAIQKQALTVIADKIARILSGDPDYADNWHDIQGYAKLVEDRLPVPDPAAAEPPPAPDQASLLQTAGFLALGAALAHNKISDSTKDALIAKGLSFDAYIEEVIKDAPLLEEAWRTNFQQQGKFFDGVWMYEIVEEYGLLKGKALISGDKFDPQHAIAKLLTGRSGW